jgi:hypothetical protein
MAPLSRHRAGGRRVRFAIDLPSGARDERTVYRRDKCQAENLLGLATCLEALLHQKALTGELGVRFQHEGLLRPDDL